MTNNGKWLETFVKQIEELVLPHGGTVTTNRKEYNDNGINVAEFDLVVATRSGTNDFVCLVECRDRPSSGAESVAWIEQLAGRKQRFANKFHKIVAVSTTGFSPGAIELAADCGIELRTVAEGSFDDASDLFATPDIPVVEQINKLKSVSFKIPQHTPKECVEELRSLFSTEILWADVSLFDSSGMPLELGPLFTQLAEKNADLYGDIYWNGGEKNIRITQQYPDQAERYFIHTDSGPVEIEEMILDGQVVVIPHQNAVQVKNYANVSKPETIATVATIKTQLTHGTAKLEVVRIGQSNMWISGSDLPPDQTADD